MRTVAISAVLLAGGAAAEDCGTPAGVCEVAGGHYRLVLPEAGGPVPAVIYLHGWGANAEAAVANRIRREAVMARGMALIVPEGVPRAGRSQRDWAVRDTGTHPRDDLAFLEAVLEDAATRGVDRDRVLLTGFSRGGSFVWDVACHAPGLARAYAPVSGAFWEPLPEGCAGGVDLFHVHGWADRVVPLEGRSVAGGRLTQGDVFAALALMREANGCTARQPDRAAEETGPAAWLRHWTSCDLGRIDLMLHTGGHLAPEGWTGRMLDWFEARLAAD